MTELKKHFVIWTQMYWMGTATTLWTKESWGLTEVLQRDGMKE